MSNVTVNDTAKFFGGEYTTGDTVAHGVIFLLLILPQPKMNVRTTC